MNLPTLAVIVLVSAGAAIATPVLAKGFMRRGTGVFYESNFLIQRAPQLCSVLNIFLIAISHFIGSGQIKLPNGLEVLHPLFTLFPNLPSNIAHLIAWPGVAILLSGLVFMIGGWISLGECFSTDAEVMNGHAVKNTGLLKYVMHPAYSGIIQSLLGASIAAVSPICTALTLFVIMPLWLNRAKYEEKLLIESLGEPYKEYAKSLNWRRLIPNFIPIGV